MKLTIEFSMDNAAFEDDANAEVETIIETTLKRLANADLGREFSFPVFDTNGNKIGTCSVSDN